MKFRIHADLLVKSNKVDKTKKKYSVHLMHATKSGSWVFMLFNIGYPNADKEHLLFCKFNPYSEVYEDLEIQQTFIVDKILAMKAFNELILLVYWNGYVRAYHKIDRYCDDLEQICLSRNLDKHVVITPLSR